MASLEEKFEQACAARDIPHAILIASNKSGSFKYERVFGPASLREDADQKPLQLDNVMWIASCTKIMTSIAAMQCVERGQLSLDAPVYDILPELRDREIFEGVDDDGKPKLKTNPTPITLRHLLTHSSGITYEEMIPGMAAWRKSTGTQASTDTIVERYGFPLVFEPGTQWLYGASIDWVGKMVERVNNNTSLQAYMEKHVWGPVGIKDMTFHLASRPDLAARMTDMNMRDENLNNKVRHTQNPFLAPNAKDDFGGHGIFTTAPELHKFIHAVLANEDDERLLKRATYEQVFSPQLTAPSRASLNKIMKLKGNNRFVLAAGYEEETDIDWGLLGLLVDSDVPGWTNKGTLVWHGLPNLSWWVDRKAGLAVTYASQLLPPADEKTIEYEEMFAREMYRRYVATSSEKL